MAKQLTASVTTPSVTTWSYNRGLQQNRRNCSKTRATNSPSNYDHKTFRRKYTTKTTNKNQHINRKQPPLTPPTSVCYLNEKKWQRTILSFKNHENVWTDIKKRQRPNTIQILWIVKNQEHRNIAPFSLQLRSYKNILKVRTIFISFRC